MTLQDTLILSEKQREQLQSHAVKSEPNESCALLFGKRDDKKMTIQEIFLTKNADVSQTRFTIPNDELILGYKTAEEHGLEMVGVFHSHPASEAVPSQTDKEFMEINPVVWVIYSGVTREFRAYCEDKEIPITYSKNT